MTSSIDKDARRAIGETEVSPLSARVFSALTLGVLFLVAGLEWSAAWPPAREGWTGIGAARGVWEANQALRESMQAFEDRLREEGILYRALIGPLQRFKTAGLRLGTESVLIGSSGWLHFAPDVRYLIARPREMRWRAAAEAIDDFAAQLRARGIQLALLPVPVKTARVPDTYARRAGSAPIERAEFDAWLAERERAGVMVVNPSRVWDRDPGGEREYLIADTHWTFDAMDCVARALAERLRELPDLPPPMLRFEEEEEIISDIGDLARMLGDGLPISMRTAQMQTVRSVREGDFAWRADQASPVLLLGDSFSNIYSMEALGWGRDAGLAERLSFHLGFSVDRIVRNDAGAHATRELLARDLARGRDRLAGKRVVIWQFAARELAHGDWRRIPLVLGVPRASVFVRPPSEPAVWTGQVAAVSAIPTPGRVPYADHIAALHLVDLYGAGVEAGEAYAFAWSMTNHQRTAAARLRPGDNVRVRVSDWNQVADRLEGINRSELDGEEFWSADIVWAEVLP